jgi:HD-GYP domain-containing protein (c-di-GMP phosphodiesterase class II)
MKQPHELTPAEHERLRLHPYTGERVVSAVPAFERLAPLVGAHHERMDGQGYPRALPGRQMPIGARIIAVADRFDELVGAAMDDNAAVRAAVNALEREAGASLWPDAVQALSREMAHEGQLGRRPRREWPAGLTEREAEVLRLVAQGRSTREIAERLVLTENTARHHIEHIYDKLDVSTRAAATLFAVENGLV